MIGVGVGVDDGVDRVDAVGDALEAKLGRGVDEDFGVFVRDQDGRTGALGR